VNPCGKIGFEGAGAASEERQNLYFSCFVAHFFPFFFIFRTENIFSEPFGATSRADSLYPTGSLGLSRKN
jgi:hypothetical protein